MCSGVIYKRPSEATPLRISIFSLEGVTIKSFSQLNNARRYTPTEIHCLVDWFNKSQAKWGIQELLLTAVEEYCRELVSFYLNRNP